MLEDYVFHRPRKVHRPHYVVACLGMHPDERKFRIAQPAWSAQDLARHADLADVVHQRCVVDPRHLVFRQPKRLGYRPSEPRYPLLMARSIRIPHFNDASHRQDGLFHALPEPSHGIRKLRLSLPSRGHILHHRDNVPRASVSVRADQRGHDPAHEGGAVLADIAILCVKIIYDAGSEPLYPGADIPQVVRMGQVLHQNPGHLLRHAAEHPGHSPVRLHDPGIQIHNGHAQLSVFEHAPEPFLALAQDCLGPFSPCDVLEKADNGAGAAAATDKARRRRQ